MPSLPTGWTHKHTAGVGFLWLCLLGWCAGSISSKPSIDATEANRQHAERERQWAELQASSRAEAAAIASAKEAEMLERTARLAKEQHDFEIARLKKMTPTERRKLVETRGRSGSSIDLLLESADSDNERAQLRSLFADAVKQKEIDNRIARAKAEAEEKRRAAEAARPVARCGGTVPCCDGTCSPTCTSNHRGCCSHHGGVCNLRHRVFRWLWRAPGVLQYRTIDRKSEGWRKWERWEW